MSQIRLTHVPTGTLLAEGPIGWGITPFEGNFYIGRRHLKTDKFRVNFIPGLCIYKFVYVWLDLALCEGKNFRSLAWLYWLPNPLLPFIWYRVALPGNHPDIRVERLVTQFPAPGARSSA